MKPEAAKPAPIDHKFEAVHNVTYVVGHKNPDADAICSAIAYTAFKEQQGEKGVVAARCGNSNARIDTILRRFNQPLPFYLSDVSPRVHDLMISPVVSVEDTATCAEALEMIDRHGVSVLPITNTKRKIKGTVTLGQMGSFFVPHINEPRQMRQVHTSLGRIMRSLQAKALHIVDETKLEELFVRIGAMDVGTFWKISERENLPPAQSIIIVGDRRDVQLRAIKIGIRALIISGDLPVDPDVLKLAQKHDVSVISSPHDTATTAWVVRTASTLDRVIDRNFDTVNADTPIDEVRKKFGPGSTHALLVTDEAGVLQGILTKSDLLKPVQTRLVLVDHNEMTQAVNGAEDVTITEIIDHHRLGALNTQQPILFINEPVGSTCTIVADLFRREGLIPSPEIAGIMMSGLISDTLHLNSPTTTPKDGAVLAWLSGIAGVNSRKLADDIFSSGSVILASAPDNVVRSDFKIYEEAGVRFAVSQVEELGFGNFWEHAKPIATALRDLRNEEGLAFACLLVTDINTQNSLLLVKGDAGFINRISYPHVEKEEIFDLPGIVSRKKQLIPYLGSVLREMAADGASPGNSTAPFAKSKQR
ncbi:MAG: putative manganese-dependent inorganic diphosphatase [Cephaloticoccus sp.]|nr:putative manganese-dependent inorganic diphosphatase [Cephaloticoccus sp.]MCF7759855.1 putative manganese-dependent inorganic diphosphatase [Cephaloticoccus sp.]